MKSFFVLLICLVISTPVLAAGGVLPGSGTDGDPYLIEDVNDFDAFAADPNYWAAGVHTKLMTDIDLSGRTYTTAVIAPDTDNSFIYFQGIAFEGTFNGNKHTILNLKCISTSNDYLGLFGQIGWDGAVSNLIIEDCIIECRRDAGGLAGHNNGIVSESYANGTISGVRDIGGLIGWNEGVITNCFSKGNVNGDLTSVVIGGLIGLCKGGNLSNSYSDVECIGGYSIGGLVGYVTGPVILNCYSTGSVTGIADSGGLIGDDDSAPTITSCYFLDSAGPDNGYGIPLDDPNMMVQVNFVGWDFSTPIWRMIRPGEDYPRLAWQEVFDGDIAGLYGVDLTDFAEIARNWQNAGCPANCEDADIDESGDVGIGDLVYVANDWLKK